MRFTEVATLALQMQCRTVYHTAEYQQEPVGNVHLNARRVHALISSCVAELLLVTIKARRRPYTSSCLERYHTMKGLPEVALVKLQDTVLHSNRGPADLATLARVARSSEHELAPGARLPGAHRRSPHACCLHLV